MLKIQKEDNWHDSNDNSNIEPEIHDEHCGPRATVPGQDEWLDEGRAKVYRDFALA